MFWLMSEKTHTYVTNGAQNFKYPWPFSLLIYLQLEQVVYSGDDNIHCGIVSCLSPQIVLKICHKENRF